VDGGVNGNGRENANTSLDSAWGCSIDDHNHLEMDVGTTARLGGCMRQTEAWDMSKSALLALTLIFIMGGPNFKKSKFLSRFADTFPLFSLHVSLYVILN